MTVLMVPAIGPLLTLSILCSFSWYLHAEPTCESLWFHHSHMCYIQGVTTSVEFSLRARFNLVSLALCPNRCSTPK